MIAKIVEVVPFVFMADEKVLAKIVEVVPFVFMVDEKVIVKIVEVVTFVLMVEKITCKECKNCTHNKRTCDCMECAPVYLITVRKDKKSQKSYGSHS